MGILIVYDVTDEKSFNNVYGWLKNVSQFAPEGIYKILVGNKQDSEDKRVSSILMITFLFIPLFFVFGCFFWSG